MGDLTRNFSRHEFECHCGCGSDDIDHPHVARLQRYRDFLNARYQAKYGEILLLVRSGVRCQPHNNNPKSKGGAGSKPSSQHTWCDNLDDGRPCGSDIVYFSRKLNDFIDPREFENDVKEFGEFRGVGFYSDFHHLDSRHKQKYTWKAY